GGLYDTGDYEAVLDAALQLVRYEERRAEQAAGAAIGIGGGAAAEPSISNMGYIPLALTPDERAAGLPKSGNTEGCTITISPLGGVSVRLSTTPQGQGHRTVAAQIVADRLGCGLEDVDVLSELDTSVNAWSV